MMPTPHFTPPPELDRRVVDLLLGSLTTSFRDYTKDIPPEAFQAVLVWLDRAEVEGHDGGALGQLDNTIAMHPSFPAAWLDELLLAGNPYAWANRRSADGVERLQLSGPRVTLCLLNASMEALGLRHPYEEALPEMRFLFNDGLLRMVQCVLRKRRYDPHPFVKKWGHILRSVAWPQDWHRRTTLNPEVGRYYTLHPSLGSRWPLPFSMDFRLMARDSDGACHVERKGHTYIVDVSSLDKEV